MQALEFLADPAHDLPIPYHQSSYACNYCCPVTHTFQRRLTFCPSTDFAPLIVRPEPDTRCGLPLQPEGRDGSIDRDLQSQLSRRFHEPDTQQPP